MRFDTHFFLAPLPDDGQEATIDGDEIVDQRWFTPAGALAANERGEIELLSAPSSTSSSWAASPAPTPCSLRERPRRRPVQPRVVTEGERPGCCCPASPATTTSARGLDEPLAGAGMQPQRVDGADQRHQAEQDGGR